MRIAAAALTVLALTTVGCGSSEPRNAAPPSTTATTAPAGGGVLDILVTNDDGFAAPGIDGVVEALRALPDTKVTVVAPATNQSGAGDATTAGDHAQASVKTASGYPATSVVGKPADAVIAALEALHLQPDVVISGTNLGQNFGPFSKLSGTVGAALTAARRGIPALASSADLKSPDFRSASRLVVDWVKQHRAELLSGKAAATVTSLNVPTCPGGPRGVVDEPTATDFGDRKPTDVDCASTTDKASFGDDVDAYLNGYAALSPVPLR